MTSKWLETIKNKLSSGIIPILIGLKKLGFVSDQTLKKVKIYQSRKSSINLEKINPIGLRLCRNFLTYFSHLIKLKIYSNSFKNKLKNRFEDFYKNPIFKK